MERQQARNDEMKDFLLVVRNALLMIVAFIDKRYGLRTRDDNR